MKTRTISQSMHDARIKELDEVKEAIYHANIDSLTCRMTRRKAEGIWTEQDQKEYDEAAKKCKELIAIEEAKPLFPIDEKLVIVSDEEYSKLLEEYEKKQEAERITPPQIEAIAEAKKANLQKAIEEAPTKKKTTKNTK